jgi:hypothetical protein
MGWPANWLPTQGRGAYTGGYGSHSENRRQFRKWVERGRVEGYRRGKIEKI